jgi:hypothetical protein
MALSFVLPLASSSSADLQLVVCQSVEPRFILMAIAYEPSKDQRELRVAIVERLFGLPMSFAQIVLDRDEMLSGRVSPQTLSRDSHRTVAW